MAMEDSPLAACSSTTSPGRKQGGRRSERTGFHCAARLCNLVGAVYLCNPIRHDCSQNSLGAESVGRALQSPAHLMKSLHLQDSFAPLLSVYGTACKAKTALLSTYQ